MGMRNEEDSRRRRKAHRKGMGGRILWGGKGGDNPTRVVKRKLVQMKDKGERWEKKERRGANRGD